MKNQTLLTLTETYRPWLTKMNLLSFEQLMFSDQGSIIEKTEMRDIRRIEGHGKVAFLKRRLHSKIGKSLVMIDRETRCPHAHHRSSWRAPLFAQCFSSHHPDLPVF